jgi:diguanylate cyclase (GGDEF)-like protein
MGDVMGESDEQLARLDPNPAAPPPASLSGGLDAAREAARRSGWAALVYGAFGVFLACFVVLLVLHPHGSFWTFFVNWVIDGFEVMVAVTCLVRAVFGGTIRPVALALGLGLLAWALGDVVFSVQTVGGGNPPTPSWDDALYLAFYPLTYVGVILLLRMEVREVPLATWLDGVVAGLGAATLTAAFVFETIVRSIGGSPAEVATNLAYPVGDLVLVALVVGALTVLPTWRNPQLLILALGCGLLAVGDTVYLFQSSANTYQVGTLLDATWPVAMVLMSGAVWLRSTPAAAAASPQTFQFVVPTVAAACGLAVLFEGALGHVGPVAATLALLTLVAVMGRSLLYFRALRGLTKSREREAMTDELTGLGNRRYLMNMLDGFFARGQADHLALLLIDLNHFKEINDSFGHQVGDSILALLGSRLREALAVSDTLVRLGGDEFGIVLTGENALRPNIVAERITTELEFPFALEVANLHVGASIGIAMVPDHAGTASELLRCADVAMYRAKVSHRPFDVYEAATDTGLSRIKRVEQFRNAMDSNALELYYQPQFDVRTGLVPAVEALLRWPQSGVDVLLPADFIPLAEEAGLMKPVAEWVLEAALAQCARWHAAGNAVSISVNLSTTNLLDVDLLDRIRFLLARHRLGAEFLVLELTETTLMNDWRRSRDIVQRLHNLGLTVSVDDFGTGYSSLAYLSELAIGEIKIDQAMIQRLSSTSNRKDEAIVRASIELGHSLGVRVIAEGVEDAKTLELLASLGCDLVQGYFLGRPQPAGKLVFPSSQPRALNVRELSGGRSHRVEGR